MNRIAILSNVTMELVAEKLKRNFEVYIPEGFNTWQQEIFYKESGLYNFLPDIVFVILYANPYEKVWMELEEGREHMKSWLDALKSLCSQIAETPVFVSSLDIRQGWCKAVSERSFAARLEADWVKGVEELGQGFIFPLKEIVTEMGRREFYSPKIWYMGNSPFSLRGSEAVAKQICRSCFYIKGVRKKCLAVDLDNTLWGGVIGEDGVDGIILDSHKEGGRYYDMQKCLKWMKKKGVMLAIVSKNNQEDVTPVFCHPSMVLKEEDFVSQKINWKPKPENIREIARELNIGLDAFVFLDDNPAEREQMREQCPEVEVVEFPKDTCLLPQIVEDIYDQYFRSLFVTREDGYKTEQYRFQTKRKEIEMNASSVEDYLRKLEIVADIHLMREEEKSRVIQLAGKTNQFNVTTIRYDESQLNQIERSGSGEIVVAQMQDRFGEEGLIAVAVVIYEGEIGRMESFLMSCRVMGRQLEDVVFHALVKWIRLAHPEITKLEAEYRRTRKNQPVEELYERLGFQVKETLGKEDEIGFWKRYEVELKSIPTFVSSYKQVFAFEKERQGMC